MQKNGWKFISLQIYCLIPNQKYRFQDGQSVEFYVITVANPHKSVWVKFEGGYFEHFEIPDDCNENTKMWISYDLYAYTLAFRGWYETYGVKIYPSQ